MCALSQEKKNKKEGAQYKNSNANRKLEAKARALLALSLSLFPPTPRYSLSQRRACLFSLWTLCAEY